jgi:hypothetical protein
VIVEKLGGFEVAQEHFEQRDPLLGYLKLPDVIIQQVGLSFTEVPQLLAAGPQAFVLCAEFRREMLTQGVDGCGGEVRHQSVHHL